MTMNRPSPPPPPERELTAITIAYYDEAAESYRAGTWDHDVSQNRAALLDALAGSSPLSILDLGCGPGRDLHHFKALGHEAIGVDGARAFVDMAQRGTGCEVWHQDFIDLKLPPARFDGVFANASLFHAPRSALPRVLAAIAVTLKPDGVLFCSNPRGNNQEGFNGNRYGCFYDFDSWHALVSAAGFRPIDHYYRPHGLPREQQPWLASVWRKPARHDTTGDGNSDSDKHRG